MRRNARRKRKEKNTKKEGRAERIMSCNFGQKVKGEEKEKKQPERNSQSEMKAEMVLDKQ